MSPLALTEASPLHILPPGELQSSYALFHKIINAMNCGAKVVTSPTMIHQELWVYGGVLEFTGTVLISVEVKVGVVNGKPL